MVRGRPAPAPAAAASVPLLLPPQRAADLISKFAGFFYRGF